MFYLADAEMIEMGCSCQLEETHPSIDTSDDPMRHIAAEPSLVKPCGYRNLEECVHTLLGSDNWGKFCNNHKNKYITHRTELFVV